MILISQGVTWSATVATGFTFLCASTLSATASAEFWRRNLSFDCYDRQAGAGLKGSGRSPDQPRSSAGLSAERTHAGEVLLRADARTTRRTFDAPPRVEGPAVELCQLLVRKVHQPNLRDELSPGSART